MILLNPGPVNVTRRVRQSLLGPDICHREPEFSALLQRVRSKLAHIFKISHSHRIVLYTGSGTSVLEAMLSPLGSLKGSVLCLSNGVYGARLKTILETYSIKTHFLSTPTGLFPDTELIETLLKTMPSIHTIAMVHHETSTGMLNPLDEVSRLARRYNKLLAVDTISSLAAEPIDLSRIDLFAGTSGKCLHGFPGIAFVGISKKAQQALRHAKARSLSLDLMSALASQEKGETSFTPAVQILYAFDTALDELKTQGLNQRIRHYRLLSDLLHQGMKALGIHCLIDPHYRSHVLAAFWLPRKISYQKLHDTLKKKGFVIYAGQSSLKHSIFRIAHLGDISVKDLRRFLKTLERLLPRS